MTRAETISLALDAGFNPMTSKEMTMFENFAKLVAEKEREVVATWIMDKGFATGHGDSIVDLLDQLEWQIAEKEREACAEVCDVLAVHPEYASSITKLAAQAIRNRGQA